MRPLRGVDLVGRDELHLLGLDLGERHPPARCLREEVGGGTENLGEDLVRLLDGCGG